MAADQITALAAYWTTEAASLSGEDRLECELAIARWTTVQTALDALEGQGLQSYTMAGNSYTRRDIPAMQASANALRMEIRSYVSGGGSRLIDNRLSQDSYIGGRV